LPWPDLGAQADAVRAEVSTVICSPAERVFKILHDYARRLAVSR